MMLQYLTRLLPTVMALAFCTSAFAQQVPQGVKDVRKSVYRVGYVVGDKGGHATAWAVNSNTLITNAHVIKGLKELEKEVGKKGSIFIVDAAGKKTPVYKYEAFENADIATLRVASTTLQPLKILPGEFPVDTAIWNLSYPGVADNFNISKDAQISEGNVQSYFDYTYPKGQFNITRVLKHDAASGPGSSGSPILNECGAVVGLHFGGKSSNGAGLPGASRLAISSQLLADYLAVESRSTKYEIASKCYSNGVPTLWYIVGFLVFAIIGIGFAVKSKTSSNETREIVQPIPTPAPLPKTVTSLMLKGTENNSGFEIQAAFKAGNNALQIGSSAESINGNDLILRFPAVSRIHAKIERIGGSLRLTDLDSTNGTFVKGERIAANESVSIAIGEKISFADIEVKVTLV